MTHDAIDVGSSASASAGPISIRTVEIDGAPWFVAADIGRVLGRTNPTMALRMLDSDEQTLIRNEGQKQGAAPSWKAINESGLYKLVMRSDKPEARKFQDWVTREVLPAIRKVGRYIMGEAGRPMGALRDSLQRHHHCPLPIVATLAPRAFSESPTGFLKDTRDHERPDLRYRR